MEECRERWTGDDCDWRTFDDRVPPKKVLIMF